MTMTSRASTILGHYAFHILGPAFVAGGISMSIALPAHADSWGKSNGLSRVVVHAICGNPINKNVVKDVNGCFCGKHLSYKVGSAAKKLIKCGDRNVPNYAHKEVTPPLMLQELVKIFYGGKVETWGFCKTLADGECTKKETFRSIGLPKREEAYFVGHLTAALVGKDNCIRASQNKNPDSWAMGTSLAEFREGGIEQLKNTDGWMEQFQLGCNNDDYQAVWQWIKSQ